MVSSILTWLFVIVSLLMTFLILLQEGKGGGLTALGGTKAAGVEGVTNPIRRATGYLAGIFFMLAITIGILHRPDKGKFVAEEDTADSTTLKSDAAAAPTMDAKTSVVAPAAPAVEIKPAEPKTGDVKPPVAPVAPAAGDAKPAVPKAGEAPPAPVAPVEAPKADAPKVENANPAIDIIPEAPKAPAANDAGNK